MVSANSSDWAAVPRRPFSFAYSLAVDLQDIRAQLEGLKSITAISDEMRDVIETEWPDLAAKLLPPKDGP